MKFTRNGDILMGSTAIFCFLSLLIGCSADRDKQPAHLVNARAFDVGSLKSYPFHENGRGAIWLSSIIELTFDEPVRRVSINSVNAESDETPPAAVWTLDSSRLDVWDGKTGFNASVILTINYEDEAGVHSEKLDVTLAAYSVDVFPPAIISGDPQVGEVNVDAARLNREGIKIGFDRTMDTQRTRIVVYSGRMILRWEINWTEDYETAILFPKSEDDRLLPGRPYEVRLLSHYDMTGLGRGAAEGAFVIRFWTANQ